MKLHAKCERAMFGSGKRSVGDVLKSSACAKCRAAMQRSLGIKKTYSAKERAAMNKAARDFANAGW